MLWCHHRWWPLENSLYALIIKLINLNLIITFQLLHLSSPFILRSVARHYLYPYQFFGITNTPFLSELQRKKKNHFRAKLTPRSRAAHATMPTSACHPPARVSHTLFRSTRHCRIYSPTMESQWEDSTQHIRLMPNLVLKTDMEHECKGLCCPLNSWCTNLGFDSTCKWTWVFVVQGNNVLDSQRGNFTQTLLLSFSWHLTLPQVNMQVYCRLTNKYRFHCLIAVMTKV